MRNKGAPQETAELLFFPRLSLISLDDKVRSSAMPDSACSPNAISSCSVPQVDLGFFRSPLPELIG